MIWDIIAVALGVAFYEHVLKPYGFDMIKWVWTRTSKVSVKAVEVKDSIAEKMRTARDLLEK